MRVARVPNTISKGPAVEKILLKNKYYFKIQKHFQTLKNVLNPIVALIKEPITIVFYSLVWLIKFPINLIRLIKD